MGVTRHASSFSGPQFLYLCSLRLYNPDVLGFLVDSNEPLDFILMVLKPSGGQGWVLLESSWPWGVPCPNSAMYCPFILPSCLLPLTGDSSWWQAGDTTPRRSGRVVQNGGIVPICVLLGLTVARRRERQGHQAQQPLHLHSMGACVCQSRGTLNKSLV